MVVPKHIFKTLQFVNYRRNGADEPDLLTDRASSCIFFSF